MLHGGETWPVKKVKFITIGSAVMTSVWCEIAG